MNKLTESWILFRRLQTTQKLVLLRIFIVINVAAYLLATRMPFDSTVADISLMMIVYALACAFMLWLGVMRGIGFHRKTLDASGLPVVAVNKPPLMGRYLGMVVASLLISLVIGFIVTNMDDGSDLTTGETLLFLGVEAVVMGVALLWGLRLGWQAVVAGAAASVPARAGPTTPASTDSKGMKRVWIGLLAVILIGGGVAFAVVQYQNSGPEDDLNAPVIDNSPAGSDSAPAPSDTSQDITAPITSSNPYPKGMAQNTDECGQRGYDSNNMVCHPVGQPIADSGTDDGGLPPAVNAINDQLAKLGTLSVTTVNSEGYPVFEMECNAQGQCVNGTGVPMGSITDIAQEMTTVRAADITRYGYRCTVVCVDGQGNIIGRPQASP